VTAAQGEAPAAPADQTTALLSFRDVTKQFSGTVVVDRVSFDVEAGSIVALLGGNGAGKSTLIKMLAGVYRRDGGRILYRGRDVDEPGVRSGLAFIHQDLGLIEWMTVAENMAFSYGFGRRAGFIDWRRSRNRAAAALEAVGGGINPDSRIFDLTRTEKSLVAIARALALEAEVLVLDEPTASLPSDDVERLFAVLRALRDRGVGMIYVTHRLDEVFRLSDRVAVMRNGRLVGIGDTATLTEPQVVEMIVGRELEKLHQIERQTEHRTADRDVAVELRGVTIGDVGPVDLEIHAGEIVGLTGLRGAGQELVGRAMAGIQAIDSGTMRLLGEDRPPHGSAAAVAAGIAFVTSNREAEGLARGMTVSENLFINPSVRGRKLHHLASSRMERRHAAEIVDRYGVKPRDPERLVETLSGGNQQKVILARWLDVPGALLVLEEPTMGVDVGAKVDIYVLLQEAAAAGKAVAVVSNDFEEIVEVCTRAIVFNRGRIAAELDKAHLSEAALIDAASSTASSSSRA
jgi:ribose transport system ATP-binding protein